MFMSTVKAGGLQGDKVSAIQKRHMVESDTLERKRHSRLSRIEGIMVVLFVSVSVNGNECFTRRLVILIS